MTGGPVGAQITVPGRTKVWLGDVGTTAPATAIAAPGTGWFDVGYSTEDSTQIATSPNFQDVRAAQSDFPVRTFQVSDDLTISADLIQWNADVFIAAFGGGAVSGSAGSFTYTPPLLGARKERACMIDVIDGAKHYRFIFPRTLQKEGVTTALNKGGEAKLPLRLTLLGSDGGTPWTMLTDDASFASATLT
jgi:hypothetical protein